MVECFGIEFGQAMLQEVFSHHLVDELNLSSKSCDTSQRHFRFRGTCEIGRPFEIFAAYLGEGTPINLARGLNAQWYDGGLVYAPPFR